MSVIVLAAALMATTPAEFGFDRVDVVAELPGTFIHDDVPQLSLDPLTVTVRFVEQLQFVFTTPVRGMTVGASISAQNLFYAVPLPPVDGLEVQLGLQTRLLLPVGLSATVAMRFWHLRVGVGVAAGTTASWDRPNYDHVYVLPTLSIGIGRLFTPGS